METTTAFKLTEKQEEARKLISSDAPNVLLEGGARSAKTFMLVRTAIIRALIAPNSRHLIVRFRFSHVKLSIIYDTFPKVMELCFPDVRYNLNKSDWFVTLPNKSTIWFGGLDDKERTEKILGNEYTTIMLNECSQISYSSYLILITRLAQRCYYMRAGKRLEMRLKMFFDMNPPTRGHWIFKLFHQLIDPDTKRALKNPEDYAYLLMNPTDNLDNLSEAYIKTLDNLPKRQRDRFYLGLYGDETENALWSQDIIEKSKVDSHPDLVRIVVAVDPSGASDDPEQNNDDIGIVAAGLGTDGIGYLLEDVTLKAGPATWGKVAASCYERHGADRVVGEVNYGGAMVEFVIRTANPNISYKQIHASRSKMLRAEPVSALHEIGKIKLVGDFPELEDELLNMTTSGYTGSRSPNRLDAFVFAMAELFPGIVRDNTPREPISIPQVKRLGR